ncbi:MAG: DUF4124 domain-containing protein [Moraxellaceae bacterium]
MTSTLATLITAILLTTTAGAAQFYKWTDDQGVTHYSEEPPPASASKSSEVKVRTRLPSGAQTQIDKEAKPVDDKNAKSQPKKDDKAAPDKTSTDKAADNQTPEQYQEKCKALKANLETMQSHGRVREADKEGNLRALSEEEKQRRMDETQRGIKAYCEG